MKYKVSELEGALLDAAVAKTHGWRFEISPSIVSGDICFATVPDLEHGDGNGLVGFHPSISWEHGGPIIEQHWMMITPGDKRHKGAEWHGRMTSASPNYAGSGPGNEAWGSTPLIAAMRAYVASKFGEEIDLGK